MTPSSRKSRRGWLSKPEWTGIGSIAGVLALIPVAVAVFGHHGAGSPSSHHSSRSSAMSIRPASPGSNRATPFGVKAVDTTSPSLVAAPTDSVAAWRVADGSRGHPLISLKNRDHVDFDTNALDWNVTTTYQGNTDLEFSYTNDGKAESDLFAENDAQIAIGSGPADYETCSGATAYQSWASVRPGETLCVRTGGRDLIAIRVVAVDDNREDPSVTFNAAVWDA